MFRGVAGRQAGAGPLGADRGPRGRVPVGDHERTAGRAVGDSLTPW